MVFKHLLSMFGWYENLRSQQPFTISVFWEETGIWTETPLYKTPHKHLTLNRDLSAYTYTYYHYFMLPNLIK